MPSPASCRRTFNGEHVQGRQFTGQVGHANHLLCDLATDICRWGRRHGMGNPLSTTSMLSTSLGFFTIIIYASLARALSVRSSVLSNSSESLIVETTSGKARGFLDNNTTSISLEKWFGIRYAQDTSGQNRWRPPQPYRYNDTIFNATAFGPACLQGRADGGSGTSVQSEDCLRINVIAPVGAKELPIYLYS